MPTNELTRVLEDLVDANSLYDVLQALTDIAHERSLNVPSGREAARWHRADDILHRAANKIGEL
jgi:hypothetical protein